jgi:hypothetical protein
MSIRIDIGVEADSLTDAEREAVRLYYEEVADLRTISALTGLSVRAVRAATDRVAALATDRTHTAAKHPGPSGVPPPADPAPPRRRRAPLPADPAPPRRRVVRPAQLPGAHTPPTAELPLRELVAPADTRPALAAVTASPAAPVRAVPQPAQTAQAPDDGPGSPAWNELATSPAVRRWAVADGWQVPGRGQPMPGAIVLAYRAAHPTGGAS